MIRILQFILQLVLKLASILICIVVVTNSVSLQIYYLNCINLSTIDFHKDLIFLTIHLDIQFTYLHLILQIFLLNLKNHHEI